MSDSRTTAVPRDGASGTRLGCHCRQRNRFLGLARIHHFVTSRPRESCSTFREWSSRAVPIFGTQRGGDSAAPAARKRLHGLGQSLDRSRRTLRLAYERSGCSGVVNGQADPQSFGRCPFWSRCNSPGRVKVLDHLMLERRIRANSVYRARLAPPSRGRGRQERRWCVPCSGPQESTLAAEAARGQARNPGWALRWNVACSQLNSFITSVTTLLRPERAG